MSLTLGTRLGPYEITAKLGEGGMGEVWRARDFHLGREVALKVLPEGFTADPERAARFEREAKLLASLNHPNIAQVFGLEAVPDGTRALVMELVEGPTLAERMARGALSVEECCAIAGQIAEALEEAHERGIVHRDLKPQNVKAPLEGRVKVLDFGLAKALDPTTGKGSSPSASPILMNSPTLTAAGTQLGMILGTAAYMAPEQAAGKSVDRRADIWAFGVILWEMLSGRRLFDGETVPETLGAVFRQEVSFDALPPTLPGAVRRLVERCLERDPKLRLRDIGEARIVLAGRLAPDGSAPAGLAKAAPAWRRALPWTLAALAAASALALALRPQVPRAPLPPVAFGVTLPPGHVLARDEAPVLDVSPDGRTLVFVADGPNGHQLFRRRLERVEVEPIEGTTGALQPFFSPDGRWVGFYADSKIQKVALAGGAPVQITTVNAYRGATWSEGGWIVFTPSYSRGLFRVRDTGGEPEELTRVDSERKERTHRWPSALPGSPWVVYTVGVSTSPSYYDDSRIDAVRVDTGERKTLHQGAWMARFAPPGELLFQRRTSVTAVAFDPLAAEIRGPERSVLEGVGGEASSGAGYVAAGGGGTLAYVPAEALSSETGIVLVGEGGEEEALALPKRTFWYPRFSPDGKTLALDAGSGQGTDDDIWLFDLPGSRLSRFTFTPASLAPVWSPDGRWLAYAASGGDRETSVFRKRFDGVGEEERLWNAGDVVLPSSWRPDGMAIAVTNSTGEINSFLVGMAGGEPPLLADAPESQWGVVFAPDGRHIAYTSTETNVDEIFVSTYPEGRGKWQVSIDGGQQPVWSRDGRRLFFIHDDAIWAVEIDVDEGFRAGTPAEILRGPFILRTAPIRNYDVGPDGRFALVRRRTDVVAARQLEVVIGGLEPRGRRSDR